MEDQDSDWDSDVPDGDHHPVLDLQLEDRFLTSCRNGDTCHVTECLASVRVSPHVSTGLVEAARAGHAEVVEMLVVREDCDLNIRDRDGDTPLSHACCCGHYDVVKVLLSVPGLDINTSDMDLVSPLHKAIANNHLDVVELLLKQPDIKARSFVYKVNNKSILKPFDERTNFCKSTFIQNTFTFISRYKTFPFDVRIKTLT